MASSVKFLSEKLPFKKILQRKLDHAAQQHKNINEILQILTVLVLALKADILAKCHHNGCQAGLICKAKQ